ncbi:MAG: indole-3-glycerol-phosphate synthase [Thermaerobacter sp.]|nr:indole-3-glycerol-phosphate synthase [Thermaerobacter sp.]
MSGPTSARMLAERFLPALTASAAHRAAAAAANAPDLWAAARRFSSPRSLAQALGRTSGVGPPLAIIAECKARSPSQGRLVEQYDPAARARAYERAGARAVSVLTEPDFFDGDLGHLTAVAAGAEVPVLRKDFLLEPAQVAEARAHGADAVLAIVRILSDGQLTGLLAAGAELGMDVLVEVHNREELARAVAAGARLVGVNNRDLDTFETHLRRALELAAALPSDVTAVAESGIRTAEDLARLAAAGYHAALVGQTLMQEGTALLGPAR